jgi:hypothetical protein
MDRQQSPGRFRGLVWQVIGRDKKPNRWKGFVLGVIASNVALIVMTFYQVKVAPALAGETSRQRPSAGRDGRGETGEKKRSGEEKGGSGGRDEGGKGRGESGALDSISLVGKHYKEGETSTAAMGRIAYRLLTGKEPSAAETQETLSYLVHWFYGMLMGGLYGAVRGGVKFPDLVGGLVYATGLWLVGDELVVPLLGLQPGPTAGSLVQHFNRLAAHLLYGAVLAMTTQALYLAHDRVVASGREPRS